MEKLHAMTYPAKTVRQGGKLAQSGSNGTSHQVLCQQRKIAKPLFSNPTDETTQICKN